MILYMIRHGESAANQAHVHAGWSLVPLTDKGVLEAKRAGKLLLNIPFDRIYCSDLPRAIQTLTIALPGVKAEYTGLLREISVGACAGRNAGACVEQYGDKYLADKARRDYRPYGGENDDMLSERVHQFVRLLEERQDARVAAFCHEGCIRCMLDTALGRRHERENYPLDNGSVSTFEFDGTKWTLQYWNRTEGS